MVTRHPAMIALLFALSGHVAAAAVVNATVNPQRIYEGETVTLTVSVEGSRFDAPPDVSAVVKDFAVRGTPAKSTSTQIVMSGGRQNVISTESYSWTLLPKRTGVLTIPPIKVSVGGKTYYTPSLTVTVLKSDKMGQLQFSIRFPVNPCYVNQAIPIELEVTSPKPPKRISFDIPFMNDPRFIKFQTARHDGILRQHQKNKGTDSMVCTSASLMIIPKQPGRYTVENASTTCYIQVGWKRYRDPFDLFEGTRVVPDVRPRTAVAPPVTLEVKPLPEENRPEAFSGIVGHPTLKVEADPTEVSVGEPIDYKITIGGLPYPRIVPPLLLKKQEDIAAAFKIQDDGVAGEIQNDSIVFHRTLRAMNASTKKIPPFQLWYFDPDKHRYACIRSRAIPLKVTSSTVVTAEEGVGKESMSPHKTEITTIPEGIFANFTGEDVLEDQILSIADMADHPLLVGLGTVPTAVYVCVLVAMACYRRITADPSKNAARRALSTALRELNSLHGKEEGIEDALYTIITTYISNRLNVPPGMTPVEARMVLLEHDLPAELVEEVESLLERLDASRFSPSSDTADPTALVEEARTLLQAMEREL